MEIFGIGLKATVLVLVLVAAFEDIRHLRIRNDICLAIMALFAPFAFTLGLHDIGMHLVSALVIFAVTAAMFFVRMLGGGDAKLLAALALWFAPQDLLPFLFVMSLAGGVLGLVALGLKKSGVLPKIATAYPRLYGAEDGWLASLARNETVVPYGVAIAFSLSLTFF